MAEAFGRAYGSDVLQPYSAGLKPALMIAPDTQRAMEEKNIDIQRQFPKSMRQINQSDFDLVINLSGIEIPNWKGAPIENWDVPDPVVMEYEDHCKIRDQIEGLVMNLILQLRRQQKARA